MESAGHYTQLIEQLSAGLECSIYIDSFSLQSFSKLLTVAKGIRRF